MDGLEQDSVRYVPGLWPTQSHARPTDVPASVTKIDAGERKASLPSHGIIYALTSIGTPMHGENSSCDERNRGTGPTRSPGRANALQQPSFEPLRKVNRGGTETDRELVRTIDDPSDALTTVPRPRRTRPNSGAGFSPCSVLVVTSVTSIGRVRGIRRGVHATRHQARDQQENELCHEQQYRAILFLRTADNEARVLNASTSDQQHLDSRGRVALNAPGVRSRL